MYLACCAFKSQGNWVVLDLPQTQIFIPDPLNTLHESSLAMVVLAETIIIKTYPVVLKPKVCGTLKIF